MLSSSSISASSFVNALVSGSAYPHPATAIGGARTPSAAIASLRHARVDIYCGHNAQALANIHTASKQLRDFLAGRPSQTLGQLEQVVWLTRQNHFQQAEQALEDLIDQMTFRSE